jgi:hypothetical protein
MSRRDHAEEMRYALAHNCSLNKARQELAKLRWRAREAARQKAADTASHRAGVALDGQTPSGQSSYWWNRD